ncbi:hypothetical protein GOBAR_DD36991 [Gossypium barbadense]|nr:hypothetical protein GOBAR_DD36991 [Gossypium barbadense]
MHDMQRWPCTTCKGGHARRNSSKQWCHVAVAADRIIVAVEDIAVALVAAVGVALVEDKGILYFDYFSFGQTNFHANFLDSTTSNNINMILLICWLKPIYEKILLLKILLAASPSPQTQKSRSDTCL